MSEPVAFEASELFSVAGRRVVVSGAAHGLGLAVASAFAGAGASVAVLDIDETALRAAGDQLSQRGTVTTRRLDVRSWNECSTVIEDVASELGGVDALINVAAIFPVGTLAELQTDEVAGALDVNVLGYTRLVKAATQHLEASPYGRVVNFGSIVALMGYPDRLTAYITSKGAVTGLTRALARELGPSGITVNTIAPGAFPTRAEDIYEDRTAYDTEVIGRQSLKRRGDVADIAAAALFLVSDGAAFVTGQTLVVDGGWMLD